MNEILDTIVKGRRVDCNLSWMPHAVICCGFPYRFLLMCFQHDSHNTAIPPGMLVSLFTTYLDSLLGMLVPHHRAAQDIHKLGTNVRNITPYNVVWRGNNRVWGHEKKLEAMDSIARERMKSFGIPFLDTTATMQATPNFPACCIVSKIHVGYQDSWQEDPMFYEARNVSNKFTASSMATNEFLQAMCAAKKW